MLRLINNVSLGISGTANSFADLGRPKVEVLDTRLVRVRLPRRIDVRGQIKIYDDDLAVVHRYLGLAGKTLAKNVFTNQQIRFFAVVPTIDDEGTVHQDLKSLIVITNEFLIYMRVFSFFKMQEETVMERSLILSERLSNIASYAVKKLPARLADSDEHYRPPMYFMEFRFRKSWVGGTESGSRSQG